MPDYKPRPKTMCVGSTCNGCSSPNCYAEGGSVDDTNHRYDNEKGVNKAPYWQPEKGKSYAGTAQRAGNTSNSDEEREFQHGEAKDEHKRVLTEMKSMPKPNLYAEGGEVEDSDSGSDMDTELNDMLGQELMSAFESKDHAKMMEGLEALVLSVLSKE